MLNSEHHVFSIHDEMTIYTAADMREQLLLELDKEGSMKIDLLAITEFDTSGYQLLLACKREAIARDKPIEISNPSSVVSEVLDLYKDQSLISQL